jgi:hypothetical protein
MDGMSFDALLRRATGPVDRKTTLRILAGAVAAASAAASLTSEAKPNAQKRCRRQRGQCLEFVRTRLCAPLDLAPAAVQPPDDCIEFYSPCCEPFAHCNAAAGFTCLARPRRLQEQ